MYIYMIFHFSQKPHNNIRQFNYMCNVLRTICQRLRTFNAMRIIYVSQGSPKHSN